MNARAPVEALDEATSPLPSLMVEIYGNYYEVPIPVQVHMVALEMRLAEALRTPEQKASRQDARSDDAEHAHASLREAYRGIYGALEAFQGLPQTALVDDCAEMLRAAHELIEAAQSRYGHWEPLSAIEYEERTL